MILAAATDKYQLVTSAAATVDVSAAYIDSNSSTGAFTGGGKQNTAISTAATTDILAAPAASTLRRMKFLSVRNKDASLTGDVTVVFNQNGTSFEVHKTTLAPNESLNYIEGIGFFLNKAPLADSRLLTGAESGFSQRTLASQVERAAVGTFVTISGTAYYIYVGRVAQNITAKFAEFHVTTIGAGAQTAEIGLFSTPAAPNKSAQTLTKIVATGTVDTTTTTGVKRNTSSFAQAVAAGTHLWAGVRFAMATTQPTCGGLAGDMSHGQILTTTGGGALTGITTAAGTIPALATATVAPDVRVTLD